MRPEILDEAALLTSRRATLLALLLLTVAAMWPFLPILWVWPWDLDAVNWITRGSPGNPRVLGWIFRSSHFIAYRPMCALSFTVDHLLFGLEAWGFRGTDLLADAVTVGATALVARALTKDDRAIAWTLVAAVAFALHPARDEVALFISRRSYSLSTALGLLAVAAIVHVSRRERRSWMALLGANLLLAMALGSNEVAFVLPIVAWLLVANDALGHAPTRAELWPRLRAVWPDLLLPAVVTVAVWARRVAVLGDVGGYTKKHLAYTGGGKKLFLKLTEADPIVMGRHALSYIYDPVSFRGADAVSPGGHVGATVVFGVLVVATLALALRGRRDPHARAGLILLVWLGGAVAVVMVSGVWFWRIGYPLALPFAVWLAWFGREVWRQTPRWWVRLSATLLVVLALVPPASHASVLWGVDWKVISGRLEGSTLVDELRPELAALEPDGGTLYFVAPMRKSRLYGAKGWLNRLHPGLRVEAFARFKKSKGGPDMGHLEERAGEPWYVFGKDAAPAGRAAKVVQDGAVRLSDVRRRKGLHRLLYLDDGVWKVARFPDAAAGADLLEEDAIEEETDAPEDTDAR